MRPPRRHLVAAPAFLLLLAAATVSGAQETVPADGSEPGPEAVPAPVARALPGLRGDVAALILDGSEGGAFAISTLAWAEAAPADTGKIGREAVVCVEIDGLGLLEATAAAGEEEERIFVEVFVYALAADGRLAGHRGTAFGLDPAQVAAIGRAGGLELIERLPLAPGRYSLRVLVHEPRSRRFALRRLELAIPGGDDQNVAAAEEPAGVLPPPLFADPAAAWVTVRHADRETPPSGVATRPVLRAGAPWRAGWPAGAWPDGARPDGKPPSLVARFLDPDRRPVHETPVAVHAAGDGRWTLAGEVPPLASGTYFLELASDGDGGGEGPVATAPPLVVYLLDERHAGAALRAWPDLLRDPEAALASTGAADPAAPTAKAPPEEDAPARRARRARIAAYRSALELLATGSRAAALDAVAAFETGEWNPDHLFHPAQQAEDAAIAALAAADPESLLPLLTLHLELYERYVAERVYHLAGPARRRVLDLAERYAESSTSDAAPALAAEALVELARDMLERHLETRARRLLEQALALDPGNGEARLRLAVCHERQGDYAAAAAELERLLGDAPSDEARVRLALNLRRIGRGEDSDLLLRRLVDRDSRDWPTVIAYQELGRSLLDAERPAAAVRLLEAGVGRFPDQPRLRLQLAYSLDRNGDSRRGRELLDAAPALAGGPAMSPRLRYHRRPEVDSHGHRQRLSSGAVARLPILARALATSAGAGDGDTDRRVGKGKKRKRGRKGRGGTP